MAGRPPGGRPTHIRPLRPDSHREQTYVGHGCCDRTRTGSRHKHMEPAAAATGTTRPGAGCLARRRRNEAQRSARGPPSANASGCRHGAYRRTIKTGEARGAALRRGSAAAHMASKPRPVATTRPTDSRDLGPGDAAPAARAPRRGVARAHAWPRSLELRPAPTEKRAAGGCAAHTCAQQRRRGGRLCRPRAGGVGLCGARARGSDKGWPRRLRVGRRGATLRTRACASEKGWPPAPTKGRAAGALHGARARCSDEERLPAPTEGRAAEGCAAHTRTRQRREVAACAD